MTYNIHKGFPLVGKSLILNQIKLAIESTNVDVVFLQEVIGQNDKYQNSIGDWPDESQFEFLADRMWGHYAYGKNAVYPEGHHGNAILSQFPILEWSNTDLTVNRLQKRGLLHAVIDYVPGNRKIHLFCVHLDLFRNTRKKQIKILIEAINKKISPSDLFILAGDFNEWSESGFYTLKDQLNVGEVFQDEILKAKATFPAFFPILKLDRVFYRNFKLLEATTLEEYLWRKTSDHLPVYARFEF